MPRYDGQANRSFFKMDEKSFDDFLNANKPGSIVKYNQFSSFSASEYAKEDDIRLIVKKSTNAADIRSFNSSEQEVIYKPDQKFRVVSRTIKKDRPLIFLEEIKDEKSSR